MATTNERALTLAYDVHRGAAEDYSALFERLVSRHQERLYRVAYRMTGDAEEAQDLLQDALIEAFRAFASFRQGSYFDRWLYRIMSRTFIDRQRARKRVKTLSLDAPAYASEGDEGGAGFDIPDPASDPALMMERATLTEPLQNALAQLAPDFRLILILADVEELSYDEISEILSCPVGTIKSRLHRARLQMKASLEKAGYIAR